MNYLLTSNTTYTTCSSWFKAGLRTLKLSLSLLKSTFLYSEDLQISCDAIIIQQRLWSDVGDGRWRLKVNYTTNRQSRISVASDKLILHPFIKWKQRFVWHSFRCLNYVIKSRFSNVWSFWILVQYVYAKENKRVHTEIKRNISDQDSKKKT